MIYFALAVGSRTVKIGHTTGRPESRLSALATGCPHDLVLLHTEEGDTQRESQLHSMYAEWRVRGEWFRLEGDLVWHLATKLIETLRPWDFAPHQRQDPACVESLKLVAEEIGGGGPPQYLWHLDGHVTRPDGIFRTCTHMCTESATDLPAVHRRLQEWGCHFVDTIRIVWTIPAFVTESHRIVLLGILNP